ncbi:MAG: hypothetical protein ACN4GW_01460 [Desulforhopalus sp.]
MKMDNTSFISETIRYQKIASDQVFQLFALCQTSSDELVQNTLAQCSWLPDSSKESYLNWSVSCQENTKQFKDLIDKGFEQVEQVFVSPATNKSSAKMSQSSQQTAAPSKITARKKKTTPAPKRKIKAPVSKVAQKSVSSKEEAPKAAPQKSKSARKTSQVSPADRNTKGSTTPVSVATKKVPAEVAAVTPKASVQKTQMSAPADSVKTPSKSTS